MACQAAMNGLLCKTRGQAQPVAPHPSTMSHATRIRKLIEAAGSQFVSVHFIKADGELRQLTFNPKHIGEIKGTGHALKDPAAIENIVRCMDIAKGWRSFDCRRVCKLTVNGETFEFNLATY
jgi:hypothetical protein